MATQEDEPTIRQCAIEAYQRYVSAIGKAPAPMVADFAKLLSQEHIYVALDETQNLMGFIVCFPTDDAMLLENVAVFPKCAGKGVGKKLIAFCESEGRRQDLKKVVLYTNEKMTENLSLYPHLGYRETARKTEDGFSRVYFVKILD